MKCDIAFLDRIEAADFVLTDSEGNILTKAMDLEEVKSGIYTLKWWVSEEMKVHIYGDAAVVTYSDKTRERYEGKDYDNHTRCTDTWVKINGRWQCVASHGSKIAQK
jgi:hypothetical protein